MITIEWRLTSIQAVRSLCLVAFVVPLFSVSFFFFTIVFPGSLFDPSPSMNAFDFGRSEFRYIYT